MATAETVSKAMAETPKPTADKNVLESFLNNPQVKARFHAMLGKKAAGFMSSVISVVSTSSQLRACDPKMVIAQAAMAAALDLPINPNLGFAAIVPYSTKGKLVPQFQMMAKGFIQLAIRSAQYRSMNAIEIYEDELESFNPITGKFQFTDPKSWKMRYEGKMEKIIGYVAFFELLNGFEKYLYMTKAQCLAHGKRYSQSFKIGKGKWADDPHVMCLKTVIKLLLSKWGILSIDMQRAIQADQAVVNEEGEPIEFPDAIDATGDGTLSETPPPANAAPETGKVDESQIPRNADGTQAEF